MSLKRCMRQSCVYWAPANTESGGIAHDNYGQVVYTDPVEKDCRWEDISEIFVNVSGMEERSRAVVMVDDVEIGGLLMLGTLDDITDLSIPKNNTGAWEIKQKEKIPNLKGTVFYEWAYL